MITHHRVGENPAKLTDSCSTNEEVSKNRESNPSCRRENSIMSTDFTYFSIRTICTAFKAAHTKMSTSPRLMLKSNNPELGFSNIMQNMPPMANATPTH